MNMKDARKEAWRLMLITSQNNQAPKPVKHTRTEVIQGVTIVTFRMGNQEMIEKYGSN